MIAFQHIETRRFISAIRGGIAETMPLLYEAYPWHQVDEDRLRKKHAWLSEFQTVTFSTRIDHPANDLSNLTHEELAQRFPSRAYPDSAMLP